MGCTEFKDSFGRVETIHLYKGVEDHPLISTSFANHPEGFDAGVVPGTRIVQRSRRPMLFSLDDPARLCARTASPASSCSEENVFKPDGGDPSEKVVHYNH